MNTFSESGLESQLPMQTFRYPKWGAPRTAHNGLHRATLSMAEQRESDARSGRRGGRSAPKREYEQAVKREREAGAEGTRRFQRERDHYYQRVEAEVVQLALSIARKVLHRESQVDPLSAGLVSIRVALLEWRPGAAGKGPW